MSFRITVLHRQVPPNCLESADNHHTHQQFVQCETNTTEADGTVHEKGTWKDKVDKIFEHVGTGDNNRYVVCWYRYSTVGCTIKPPAYVPQHFIARYWLRTKAAKKRHSRSTNRFSPPREFFEIISECEMLGLPISCIKQKNNSSKISTLKKFFFTDHLLS